MALDAIDHYLLSYSQHEHERWMQNNVFQTGELREQLADQAAANQGCRAVLKTLIEAYEVSDWSTIQAILGNSKQRMAIYQSVYDPTYISLKPT